MKATGLDTTDDSSGPVIAAAPRIETTRQMQTELNMHVRAGWSDWHRTHTVHGPDVRVTTSVCLLSKTQSSVDVSGAWTDWYHDIPRLLHIDIAVSLLQGDTKSWTCSWVL